MGSHFDCIGIPIKDRADFDKVVREFARKCQPERSPSGYSLAKWQDSSGAGLAIHLLDNAVQCVTPFFQGVTRLSVRPTRWVRDHSCPHCDVLMLEVLSKNMEMLYPMAIQVEVIEAVRSTLKLGSVSQFRVAGFAEVVESWASAAEFDRSDPPDKFRLGQESFIPIGTFSFGKQERPVTAHASISDTVLAVSSLTNSATGTPFVHLTVRSYDAEYDIVAPPAAFPRNPEPGWVVRCQCWMVGSPVVVN